MIKRGKGPKGAKGERRAGWSSSCCLSLGHGDTLSLSAFLVPPDERLVQAGHECRRGGRACRRRGHGRPLRLQRPLRQRLFPSKNGADDGHRRRLDRCVLRQSVHFTMPFACNVAPSFTTPSRSNVGLNGSNGVGSDDEEWYPPTPPPYDVADKLVEANSRLEADPNSTERIADKIKWRSESSLVEIRQANVWGRHHIKVSFHPRIICNFQVDGRRHVASQRSYTER